MSLFLSSLALTGCGTSIGIEDALHCTEVSAEPVADRDAVLDDFGASPQALLDAVLGDFSGSQLEHENQGDRADRADGEAWLTVTDPGDPVTLILYEANVEDTSVYAEEPCSPRLDVGLSVVLVADGLPTFSATVTGVVAVDGGVSLSSTDTSAFDEPLPEPVAYDPADYELVEGRVVEAATVRKRTYLNFGADWRSDFTVSLAPKVGKLFVAEGIDPLSYQGKLIRVRGWLKSYNGPLIEATHPEQIEVIGE